MSAIHLRRTLVTLRSELPGPSGLGSHHRLRKCLGILAAKPSLTLLGRPSTSAHPCASRPPWRTSRMIYCAQPPANPPAALREVALPSAGGIAPKREDLARWPGKLSMQTRRSAAIGTPRWVASPGYCWRAWARLNLSSLLAEVRPPRLNVSELRLPM